MTEDPKKDEVEETQAGASADEVGRGDERSEAVPVEEPSTEASADEVGRGDERSEAGVAETTTEDEAPVEEPAAEDEDVSPEAAEDPGVAAPEPEDDEKVVPDKPKRRTRAKKTEEAPAEEAKPAKEARPARKRDERRAVPVGLEVRAQAKYVRTSARKARLVCDHIRGKDVVEARAILAFTPRRAAEAWVKLLESAVANAEHNHELVGEDLKILSVHADEGPTLKRFRPRAMGRATRIRKRTSHLSITLTPKES
jgi:ribosomal protein L22